MTEKKELSAATRAKMKYNENHIKQIKFNFNFKYDADILEKLDQVGNKQGYIKDLIRSDIAQPNRFATLATVQVEGSEGFYTDIVLDRSENIYNLWLYHQSMGIKSLMVGLPVEAQTINDLIQAIPAFATYNVPIYQKRYMQE